MNDQCASTEKRNTFSPSKRFDRVAESRSHRVANEPLASGSSATDDTFSVIDAHRLSTGISCIVAAPSIDAPTCGDASGGDVIAGSARPIAYTSGHAARDGSRPHR